MDNGKPVRESRDLDIPLVARHFYHHAGWAQLLETEMPGYEPVGVVGQIIPWNFPLLMLAWKIAPALACGNTVVLKPAEFTPLTALLFAELCQDVGLPPGVVNIVNGDGRTGRPWWPTPTWTRSPSPAPPRWAESSGLKQPGQGRSSPWNWAGNRPSWSTRMPIWIRWWRGSWTPSGSTRARSAAPEAGSWSRRGWPPPWRPSSGPGWKPSAWGTPWTRASTWEPSSPRFNWRRSGTGGTGTGRRDPDLATLLGHPEEGFFYPPTLCTDCSPSSTLAQEEIFGPVVVLMTFRTPEESVQLANDTRYGLAASLWTENVNLALHVAPQAQSRNRVGELHQPVRCGVGFGGYRESGFGREGGKEGLFEYLQPTWLKKGRRDRPFGPKTSDESGILDSAEAKGRDRDRRSAEEPATEAMLRRGPDHQAVRGRKAGPGGWGLLPSGEGPGRNSRGRGSPGEPEGHPKRRGGRPRGGKRLDTPDRPQPGPDPLLLGREPRHPDRRVQDRLQEVAGVRRREARKEVDASIRRLFGYAAWADKYDGMVHHTPFRNVTLAMPEPIGVMGLVCPDEAPLLGFVSTVAPLIAMGNAVVAVPSERGPSWPRTSTRSWRPRTFPQGSSTS